MAKFSTEIFNFSGHISTLRAENTPKSRTLKDENNSKTLPKQLQNNFEKLHNRLFRPPKLSKMTPQNDQNFRPKLSIFWVIYQPFELKIHRKVSFLSPKTIP